MDDLEAEHQMIERKHNPLFLKKKPSKYEDMNYNDLKHLVAERGLKADGRKKKDLIDVLKKADAEQDQ